MLPNSTTEIVLSNGRVCLVDAADYDRLGQWRWHEKVGPSTSYAIRNARLPSGRWTMERMHRAILGLGPGDSAVDHINGNGLDNRRCNLRVCTMRENLRNQRKQARSFGRAPSSKFKGVMRHKNKWMAQIKIDGHSTYLGLFGTEEDAAAAYDRAARKHFGQFARPNFGEADV